MSPCPFHKHFRMESQATNPACRVENYSQCSPQPSLEGCQHLLWLMCNAATSCELGASEQDGSCLDHGGAHFVH